MDEIDWLKSVKKAIWFFTKLFGGTAMIFAVLVLLRSGQSGEEYTKLVLCVMLFIGVGIPIIIGICYIILIVFVKILNVGRTEQNFNKEYVREIPQNCSPAIASLIYDLKIDVYKDYTSTILYLCTKGYIRLVVDGDNYNFQLLKQEYSELSREEQYVLDIIKNKRNFDENQFKKEIIKQAQETGFITDEKYSRRREIVLILLISIVVLIITYVINKIVFIVLFSILLTILMVLSLVTDEQNIIEVVDTKYIRTKEGKRLTLMLKGLKRFISDYTLIKEKEIDYIKILGNYIPYALSLDEANAVEEFIKHNDEYRNLIYNRINVKE